MKKAYFLIAALLLLVSQMNLRAGNEGAKETVTARTLVKGTVTDQLTQETLAGVEVRIEGTSLRTYTDLDGNFSFENLEPGQYSLNATMISYKNVSREISLNQGDNEVKLNLETVKQ